MSAHPWRAPDGRLWFSRRRGHRILLADSASSTGWTGPRLSRVAVATRHLCTSRRAGPLGKGALWALGWAPWEF